MGTYWDNIITGIIGLIGVVLGFLLKIVDDYLTRRKSDKEEFYEIKNTIFTTTIAGNVFVELSKLRRFLIRHPACLKKEGNKQFFDKWLMHPFIEKGEPLAGYWNSDNYNEMLTDLDRVEI